METATNERETKPRASLLSRILDKIEDIIATDACPKANLNTYDCNLKKGCTCSDPARFNECREYQKHLIEGYST
jgi:hypothetical protein